MRWLAPWGIAAVTQRIWRAIESGGGVTVYAVLAGSTVAIALGSGSSASRTQQRATAGVFERGPAGR